MKLLFLLLISWWCSQQSHAQDTLYKPIRIPDIQLSDTVFPGYELPPVNIKGYKEPLNLSLSSRDRAYLRKVYPYALRISHLVEQIEIQVAEINRNAKRKQYIKDMETMLKDQFTEDVKNLTRIQGQMLTKLVHRETGQTIYDLVRKYKNGFSAGWWNLLGKFYDQDLKMKYDPSGIDSEIEQYVQYLDFIYQRNGLKENIENEQFTPPIQSKKRTRKRS
jgi:hypothetical protein